MISSRMQARVGALMVACALAGCGRKGVDTIVFSEHVQPILNDNCTTSGCHNATDRAHGFSVASYADLAHGSTFGSTIVPFAADRSPLYLRLTGAIEPRMPNGGAPLAADVVSFLKRWIDEGARDDLANVMYSEATAKAFVACQGENLVAVLDMATGRLIRLIPVEAPHSVYVDRSTSRVYVSRFETASDNIHVYDADTYELLATGQSGTFPALMMISPDHTQLFVTNFDTVTGDHRFYVLDPTTLAVKTTLDFGQLLPHGLAMTADGKTVFITNIDSHSITVIDNSDPQNITAFSVPLSPTMEAHQPQQCVLSSDEKYLFISALGTDQLFVYDVVAEAMIPGATVMVGDGPWHLTLAPSGDEVWVANWLGNSVSIVDVSVPTMPQVDPVELEPEHPAFEHHDDGGGEHEHHHVLLRPIGIIAGPDGLIYVACANDNDQSSGHHPAPGGLKNPGNVVVFDPSTREVVSVAEVPNFARFTDFRP